MHGITAGLVSRQAYGRNHRVRCASPKRSKLVSDMHVKPLQARPSTINSTTSIRFSVGGTALSSGFPAYASCSNKIAPGDAALIARDAMTISGCWLQSSQSALHTTHSIPCLRATKKLDRLCAPSGGSEESNRVAGDRRQAGDSFADVTYQIMSRKSRESAVVHAV